jgi:putative peptidoglycan lipid II flippase
MARMAARGATDDLRRTMANGVRQVCLMLIPSAVIMAVLSQPITRLVYQRGEFDAAATHLVATAMVWWSISLPFQGVSLIFSRTFFSLQKPWLTTGLSLGNLFVNAGVAAALYKPFGVAGIVIGTVAGTVVMCVSQGLVLRRDLHGIEGGRILGAAAKMLLASALLAGVCYGVWYGLDAEVGRSLPAQVLSVGAGITLGAGAYAAAAWALGIPETRQIRALLLGRRGR